LASTTAELPESIGVRPLVAALLPMLAPAVAMSALSPRLLARWAPVDSRRPLLPVALAPAAQEKRSAPTGRQSQSRRRTDRTRQAS
jgi:hypothetical protein